MDVQHKEEQVVAQSALAPGPPLAVNDRGDDGVDLTLDSIDVSKARVDIRFNAMPCDQRNVVISSLQRARIHLAPNIVLLNKDTPAGLSTKLAQTAHGGLRGTVDLITPARPKYVAIMFDVKCSGEAAHSFSSPSCRQQGLG